MSAWSFPSLNAFQAALSALPLEVVSSAVRACRHQGEVTIDAGPSLASALTAVGAARVSGVLPEGWSTLSCWAEVLPVRATAAPVHVPTVLFVCASEQVALELAGEMVRLGCDRQELAVVSGAVLLRVSGPPYYSVLRALDGREVQAELRAFVPAGQVWLEVGCGHPLIDSLRAAPGQLWLLPRDGPWRVHADGPWTPLDARLDLLIAASSLEPASPPARRLAVPLRLGRSPAKPAGLWITDDLAAVDRLVQELPESIANTLDLAVLPASGMNPERVLFRTRPRARGGSVPELPGQAFSPIGSIPGLFLPVGTAIEPPVRAERLRALLAPPEGTVGWVVREHDRLCVHYVTADNFVGLDEWVDYLLDRDGDVLETWVQGTRFQFETLVIAEPPAAKEAVERRPRERRAIAEVHPPEPGPEAVPTPRRRAERVVPIRVDLTPDAAARAVDEAERAFVALDAPGDAPERSRMWAELAALYARAGRAREAGLAWGRAAWAGGEEMVVAFHEAMAAAQGPARVLLALEHPHREQVRAVAAAVLAGATPTGDARRWLEDHGRVLDLRTFWLAMLSLSQASGAAGAAGPAGSRGPGAGDILLLARARDRVFSELQHGLSGARELPTFLRFSGVGTAARLADPLERMRSQFFTVKRSRNALEAAPALTQPYVDLVFAWGFARLGVVDRASELCASANRALRVHLPGGLDAIHEFASSGLTARVTQALDGEPAGVPLPATVAQRLNGLARMERYKVDRLRQACTILEPQESLDPFHAFTTRESDPRGERFAALRGTTDPEVLSLELGRILADAVGSPPEQAARLYDGVLDFIPALHGPRLSALLAEVLAAVEKLELESRASLAAECLDVASLARDAVLMERATKLVTTTLTPLGAALTPSGAAHPVVVRHLPSVLRSLQRGRSARGAQAGAHDPGRTLVDALLGSVGAQGGDLVARLALAGAMWATGRGAEATGVFEATWKRLGQKPPWTERKQLVRGLSRACAFATPEVAVETALRLFQQLGDVTDGDSTNSHFCITLVEYAECLVLALAHEELALGESGRRLVEEDEFLLRQRVHRDLAG